MKRLLLVSACLISFSSIFSQKNVYVITEHVQLYFDEKNISYQQDSVFVASPTGVVEKYGLPNLYLNPAEHTKQLSSIINEITQKNYVVTHFGDFFQPLGYAKSSPTYNSQYYSKPSKYLIRTIVLSEPWTSTSIGLIQDKSDIFKLSIYPNPASSVINVEYKYSGHSDDIKLVIVDSKGFVVVKKNIESIESNIYRYTINQLSPGLYVCYLISDKSYSNGEKLIIKR